jgi:hypothetical protein
MIRIAIALLGMGVVAAATRQEDPKRGPFRKEDPGKDHEFLKQFEGDWDVHSRMTPPGQTTPQESKGTESARIGLGGYWLMFDFKGSHENQPMDGHGLLGYDPQKKKYVGVWAGSVCPYLATFEGERSADGRTLTMACRSTDPKTGKPMNERMVFQFHDKDHRTLRFFGTDESGKEAPTAEMTYTRKTAEVK